MFAANRNAINAASFSTLSESLYSIRKQSDEQQKAGHSLQDIKTKNYYDGFAELNQSSKKTDSKSQAIGKKGLVEDNHKQAERADSEKTAEPNSYSLRNRHLKLFTNAFYISTILLNRLKECLLIQFRVPQAEELTVLQIQT